MRLLFLLALLHANMRICFSQETQPKLVVGIVIDQFRYDYLVRYREDFGPDGFNRVTKEGFLFRNAHFNYTPTKTGPGHASIYTGTTPARHGVVGNDWYVQDRQRNMNCVEDTTVKAVGGSGGNGDISPRNMLTTTVTDELRLFYNFQSKVVGVSFKDRGACLPAGHNPTGAYWYDSQTGEMMTSTHYMSDLPKWVQKFNKQNNPSRLLDQVWDYYKDALEYTESLEDDSPFEDDVSRDLGHTFPYDFSKFKDNYSLLKYSPFGNTFIREFAESAVINESLGVDDIPDFLTISWSSTDHLGHRYGPRARETQDLYLRLDNEMAMLLKFLDERVGKEQYTLFITADHAAADVPAYLVSQKMPGGYANPGYLKNIIEKDLTQAFGEGDWVSKIVNDQVYLNRPLIEKNEIELEQIQKLTAKAIMTEPYIVEAFTATELAGRNVTDPLGLLIQNGFHNKNSGDVMYMLASGYINDSYGRKGTDHRTAYTYDTHVPVMFFGQGIPAGNSVRRVSVTDIAPTISTLLNITLPSGATGNPLIELFE